MTSKLFQRRSVLKRHLERKSEALTPRQEQVLGVLKSGMTEREAADILGLSPHTIHSHVMAVYQRLGVNSRAQLLSLWIGAEREHGMIAAVGHGHGPGQEEN